MPDLYFPQLAIGSAAQYPIRKTHGLRTLTNVLPDGSMITGSDFSSARLLWQMKYADLGTLDVQTLQAFFTACGGPLRGFTFIDPTDNMLASSADLSQPAWIAPGVLQITPGVSDPDGGMRGFRLTNASAMPAELSQTVRVVANNQYCFSVFLSSDQPDTGRLVRKGAFASELSTIAIGPGWSRVVSSGRLVDPGTQFSVAIRLNSGQSVNVYGPQLEAQFAPSRYRATFQTGGVYANAHWAVEELMIVAEAPNLYAASLSIETNL